MEDMKMNNKKDSKLMKEIKEEIERVDGKKGKYSMTLVHGDNLIYDNGHYGVFYCTPTEEDQSVSRLENKEKAIEYVWNLRQSISLYRKKVADKGFDTELKFEKMD